MAFIGRQPTPIPLTSSDIGDGVISDANISDIAATKLTGTLSNARFPAGSIIQTVKTVITTPFTIALGTDTYTAVTGMTLNITPNFSNSIILLTAQIMGEHTYPHNLMFTFFRDSTRLGQPTADTRNVGIAPFPITYNGDAATTPEFVYFGHHDEPSSTSQITYTIRGNTSTGSSTTLFVNRTINDLDGTTYERGMSFLMAQEIKV